MTLLGVIAACVIAAIIIYVVVYFITARAEEQRLRKLFEDQDDCR